MAFRIVVADNDSTFISMLGRALLDSGYVLHPAECGQIALDQIGRYEVDGCIIDVELPGGIEATVQACMRRGKPVIAMGAAPLKATGKLVEVMYYGIPYVRKFDAEGRARLEYIMSRMNALLKTVLIFGEHSEYQKGIIAGLESKGYKVFSTSLAEDLVRSFLLTEPNAVLVYSPTPDGLHQIARIREIDARVPLAIVTDRPGQECLHTLRQKDVVILAKQGVADYLDSL